MNYSEKYEVRMRNADHPCWVVLRTTDTEAEAVAAMEADTKQWLAGAWHVVRVSEVTVAAVAKA